MKTACLALAPAFVLVLAACSSSPTTHGGDEGATAAGTWANGGSGQGGSAQGGSVQGGSAQGGSAAGGSGNGGLGQGGVAAGGSGTTAQGGSGPVDPLEAARLTCVAKINALRATKGRAPYARWKSAEVCVDGEVTADEKSGQAHGSFIGGNTCGANGQNECLGQGVGGIEGCLDQMWAEKDQPGCAGCDACADGYNPNCLNCDFYGSQTGNVCGHYVNMSAKYFSQVACGFNVGGGWDAQNFQ